MPSDPLVNRARMRHRNELRWARDQEDEDDLGDGPGEWRDQNPTPEELFDDD